MTQGAITPQISGAPHKSHGTAHGTPHAIPSIMMQNGFTPRGIKSVNKATQIPSKLYNV
jgi:hypothetical protein